MGELIRLPIYYNNQNRLGLAKEFAGNMVRCWESVPFSDSSQLASYRIKQIEAVATTLFLILTNGMKYQWLGAYHFGASKDDQHCVIATIPRNISANDFLSLGVLKSDLQKAFGSVLKVNGYNLISDTPDTAQSSTLKKIREDFDLADDFPIDTLWNAMQKDTFTSRYNRRADSKSTQERPVTFGIGKILDFSAVQNP